MKILVSDKLGSVGLERLEEADDVAFEVVAGLDKGELLEIIPGYDALIVRSATKVDADVVAAGKNLKVVGRAGIGVDNIDTEAATARGVIVMNTPEANAVATAEQALTLMLAVSRHTASSHATLADGSWDRSAFTGIQLYRKVLGIVGFGRVGRLVAARAHGFGMDVLAFDPYVAEEAVDDLSITLVDLDELLARADYVSLHAVLSPETREMINSDTIAQMKDGVILVNVARGGLVDEVALAGGLRSGKIRAAGIDVYSTEPPPPDHPLIGLPNVVHTPHLGASTSEAQEDIAIQIVDQVLDALRGRDFRNAINLPFLAGPDFAVLRPYLDLAERLGIIQFALARGPIREVELEVRGEFVDGLARPVAAALLKGILGGFLDQDVNYVNAPLLAEQHGIGISQSKGVSGADYSHLLSCRVHWEGGSRIVAGILFGGTEPRLVQVDDYLVEADPHGTILVMANKDVPGVIGRVGTLLAVHHVNIGEWRMGRTEPGGEALSFINLDSEPPPDLIDELMSDADVTAVRLIEL
jgi:D-3-phosphoglycerate dehydrogenase